MALLHKIPLVFYGENEAEYGNPIADTQSAKRDWSYFSSSDKSQIYLGGEGFRKRAQELVTVRDPSPQVPRPRAGTCR